MAPSSSSATSVELPARPALPAVSVPEITPPSDLSSMKVHLTVTDAMASDPAVQDFIQRTGAIVTRIEDTYEDIHTSQGSLGAPLSVALSIAINFVLPGGGTLMSAASAVAATLIPRFVNGLMLHGDLAGALRECTSASALKAVVLSLVVPRGGAPAGSLDLVEHFVAAFQTAVARLPFEFALGDGDFRTCVTSSLLGAASDTVTGFVASHIGALAHPGGSSEDGIPVPLSLGLHAMGGAAGAAIRGEDLLSGAMGAAMGEAAGMIYHHIRMRGLRPGTQEYDRALSHGTDVARMAAALACIPLDLDADTAARAAATAAENNAMMALPAAATRAVADLTDSPALHDAADSLESLDQALDRFDESREMLDDIADMATRQAVSGWNEVIQGAQAAVSRGEAQLEAGWARQREVFAANGINIGDAPTGGAKLLRAGMGMVRLPETSTELAADLAIIAGTAGLGKAVKAASPFVSPYIGRMAAKLEQTGAARFFGKKSTSHKGHAAPSGVTQHGPITGTMTRVQGHVHVPGGGPIRTTPATVTPKVSASKPASAPRHTAAQKVPSSQAIDSLPPLPERPLSSPYYSNGLTVKMPKSALEQERVHHNKIGNEHLHKAFQSDPHFAAAMEGEFPGIRKGVTPGKRGAYPTKTPTPELTWHHYSYDESVLELVPRKHHKAPGPVQKNLHPYPNGGGGYSQFSKKGE